MNPMYGSRNRLMRRLGRHANMTRLFHFGEAVQRQSVPSREPGMASAANATGYPLAKAFLPAPEPAGEGDPALSFLTPSLQSPSAAPHVSPAAPLERPKSELAHREPPEPVPSARVFRAPEPERLESPVVEERSQPAESDPVWNRLQNIFNRHKNKTSPQETASPPEPPHADSSSPDPSAHSPEELGQASASTGSDSPAGYEPGVSTVPSIQAKRQPASPLTGGPAGAPASGIQSETGFARTEGRPASVEISSETVPPPTTEIIQAASKSLPVNPVPASSQADKTVPARPPAGILKNDTHETSDSTHSEQPSQPSSHPIIEAPDIPEPDLQPLPLQAVWAVETARHPQSIVSPEPEVSEKPVPDAERIQRRIENAHTDQTTVQRAAIQEQIVKSTLQEVHPAQATESGIEFIPPRRPRPVSMPATTDAPVTENFARTENTPASEHALQRQVDPNPGDEIAKPGMIPTEIGPLPEDLWDLVGAETPAERTDKPQERPAPIQASKWEQALPSTSSSLPASPRGGTGQAPVVQRQAASPAIPEPGSAPPAAGQEAGEEQAGEKIDVEELARQVYSELRHRLGLEWERLRRR